MNADSLVNLVHVSLDILMLLCGLAMVLAGIIVLVSTRPLELSLRTCAAFLIACWGAWKTGVALQPHEALTLWDVVGPLGVTLWISQAVYKHHHQTMRRSSDWTEVPGLRTDLPNLPDRRSNP